MSIYEPFAGLDTVVESSHPFVDTDFPTPPVRYFNLIEPDYIIQRVHRVYPQLKNAGMGLVIFRPTGTVLFQNLHYSFDWFQLVIPRNLSFINIVKKSRIYYVKFQDNYQSWVTLEDFLNLLSDRNSLLSINQDIEKVNRNVINIYNIANLSDLTYGDLFNSQTFINLLNDNLPNLEQQGIQILEASPTDCWHGFDGKILGLKDLIKERICSTYLLTLKEYRLYTVKYTLVDNTIEKIDTKVDNTIEKTDTEVDNTIEKTDTKVDNTNEMTDTKVDNTIEITDTISNILNYFSKIGV